MDLITAVRSQQPMPHPSQSPPVDRPVSVAAAASTAPVAETLRRDAVQSLSAGTAQVSVRLAEQDEGHHPAAEARAAAMAACGAYIPASIAAGLSPLPMP